ncbi:transglycosylase domain-containing protein [Parvularcula oceani]|uniref:transglycosylase domain-containing protein n=1 Tax=Parvularcula oceani TaxID=1247963 RepID=UPI000690483C|nr:PBP1A family penicillin-binding protein [Parvularcula oceani]
MRRRTASHPRTRRASGGGKTGLLRFALNILRAAPGAVAAELRHGSPHLPSPAPLALMAGSAAMTLAMVVLIADIRFAAAVLPSEDVDLFSAGRPISVTILDREGRRIGTRGIEYDANGDRTASLGLSYREPVPLDALPPYVIDAFIATEDRRFFEHPGFDLRGLVRALVANFQAGTVVQGGSTITQQLAKNLFLSPDQTIMRKLEEMQLALWLEARLTKEEILSLYLNRIYLGAGTYGIEAAADTYFSKDATELTLAEAALLAGLPKAPSSLAPTTNMDGALRRSHEVLDNLVETGLIDPIAAQIAKAEPPDLALRERNVGYGYFLDRVTEEIYSRFGTLYEDLVVTTTLDLDMQAAAQDALSAVLDEEAAARGATQGALIAYDEEGGIVALVGGRSYEESQFNRASQARRQPGSAFKPFVYLAALESGLSPGTVIVDQPVRVGDWAPTNYDERYKGPVRLSSAVASSANSVAVQVTETIGRDRVIDAARRAGITRDLPELPSLALGTMELTLEELTAAYLPFAQGGAEVPGHAIAHVRTRNGTQVYAFEAIDGFSVIDRKLAEETTQMLAAVMTDGTGRSAALPGRPSAGKTGTTNAWRDAWFVGYTPQITAGVWVGNDEAAPMDHVTGSSLPLQIWRRFMAQAHEGLPVRPLPTGEAAYPATEQLAGLYAGLRNDLVQAAYDAGERSWFGLAGPTRIRARPAPGAGTE